MQTQNFHCNYSRALADILKALHCTLAISTYQAGKVVLFGINEHGRITQLLRTFRKPMGMDVKGNRLALATQSEVILFSNHSAASKYYPAQPETYDAFYLPKASYNTGPVDMHDVSIGNDGIYAVNTSYSCIVKVDGFHSFDEWWRPWFISELMPEDRCHLNGMAMFGGKPKYATAFNTGDSSRSWKDNLTTSGVIIDIENNRLIADSLGMPHSPRVFDDNPGKLYFLQSATGKVCVMDTGTYRIKTIYTASAFTRGLAKHGDYLFIGMSRLRKTSSTFSKLMDKGFDDKSGVLIVHEPTGKLAGEIIYQNTVDEIYDVQVIPQCLRPNILSPEKQESRQCIAMEEGVWWALQKKEDNSLKQEHPIIS